MNTEMEYMQNHFGTEFKIKLAKIEEEYEIIDMNKKFIPNHYIGKNCMDMDIYRDDELFLTLFCKKK